MTTDFTHMNTKAWITPAENLIAEWWKETRGSVFDIVCLAAQWGADQELEACIDVLGGQREWDVLSQCTNWKECRDQSEEILRAARRRQTPSLKAQALQALDDVADDLGASWNPVLYEEIDTIRRALENPDV